MKNPLFARYPSPEELYALERNARRLRSAEMVRLVRAGTAAVRNLFARTLSARNVKGLGHA